VFSVAVTPGTLWIGTEDGLASSSDNGQTWSIFRSDIPLHPEVPSDEVPDVESYAYPNPFTPSTDGIVRIRYELQAEQHVTIRIFDFGMNLIRTVVDESKSAGVREERWDGLDDRGLRIPSGPYLYSIDSSDGTTWGKILVVQ
jgi:hypothetical protein